MTDKPTARTTKLVFMGTSMVRHERNEWGDKVRMRFRTGDEVEVLSAEVDKLLEANVGGRPVWLRKASDLNEDELPRDDADPTGVNADVKRGAVTTEVKVVPKDNPQKLTTTTVKKIGSDTQ